MTTKKWNVMVYMAADNSLSEECIFSLKEMQRIGTTEGVNVIAQFHSSAKGAEPSRYPIRTHTPIATPKQAGVRKENSFEYPIGDEDGKLGAKIEKVSVPQKSRQRLAKKHAAALALQSSMAEIAAIKKELQSVSNVKKEEEELLSASNPDVLEEFLLSGIKKDSAQDTLQLVILSGHGSGALGPFLKSNNAAASLAVSDLHKVFLLAQQQLGRNIDIVLMDSCLMSMAEVAHELHGIVDLLIGAEGFELSTGWPYHRILEALNEARQKGTDARTLARDLVSKYVRYYSDYDVAGVSVDQAVCDLTQSPRLVEAVQKLATVLSKGIKKETTLRAVLLAHWRAQSYNAEQYVDLWDFCDQLIKVGVNKSIRDACQYVINVIDGKSVDGKPEETIPQFVLRSCFSGAAFQHSHGVSIYFPWAMDTQKVTQFKNLEEYQKLRFPQETGWGDFLALYLLESRRDIRNQDQHKVEELRCFIPTDETRGGLRTADPLSKGGSGEAAKVKNPPVEFFREPCQ